MNLLIPNHFDEYIIHKKYANLLSTFTIYNLQNILIYGKQNMGKKTLIYNFIKHLYNIPSTTKIHVQNIEDILKNNKKSYKCVYNTNDYYYEIDLLKNVKYIKHIINNFLFHLCSNSTLNNQIRIIIIHNVDILHTENLISLSNIMEKYYKSNRFIIISNHTSLFYLQSKLFNLCFNINCNLKETDLKNFIISCEKNYTKLSKKKQKQILNCNNLYELQLMIKYKIVPEYKPIQSYIKNIHSLLINANDILFIYKLKSYLQEIYLLDFDLKKIPIMYITFITQKKKFLDTELHLLYHLANKYNPHNKCLEFFSFIENFFIEIKLHNFL